MRRRRRGYGDVGKAWGVAVAACAVGQLSGDPGFGEAEGEDAVGVEVFDRFPPVPQARRLGRCALAPQLGDAG